MLHFYACDSAFCSTQFGRLHGNQTVGIAKSFRTMRSSLCTCAATVSTAEIFFRFGARDRLIENASSRSTTCFRRVQLASNYSASTRSSSLCWFLNIFSMMLYKLFKYYLFYKYGKVKVVLSSIFFRFCFNCYILE